VVLAGFGSLAGQFRQLLLKYDVVLMSAADAEVMQAVMRVAQNHCFYNWHPQASYSSAPSVPFE
jgi:hypothetical protein